MAKNHLNKIHWELPPEISEPLQQIKAGVLRLKGISDDNNKQFTLDGRLIGDIGELLAEHFFTVSLNETQERSVDGTFIDTNNKSRQVEVKCRRMSTAMWFGAEPEFLIVFKMHPTTDEDDKHETCSLIYAGPGSVLHQVRGDIDHENPEHPFPKKFKNRQTISLNQIAKHFNYQDFIRNPSIPFNKDSVKVAT